MAKPAGFDQHMAVPGAQPDWLSSNLSSWLSPNRVVVTALPPMSANMEQRLEHVPICVEHIVPADGSAS